MYQKVYGMYFLNENMLLFFVVFFALIDLIFHYKLVIGYTGNDICTDQIK